MPKKRTAPKRENQKVRLSRADMSLPFVIAFIILLAILFNVSVEWKVVVTIIMLILGIFVLVLFIGLNKRDIRLR
ncbi:MAG: hypothetical protein ACXAEN_25380 [Candidatus Thorarchaeota archaeon]|jgi:archaellum biogenesis protein FlaJ (TadC family)